MAKRVTDYVLFLLVEMLCLTACVGIFMSDSFSALHESIKLNQAFLLSNIAGGLAYIASVPLSLYFLYISWVKSKLVSLRVLFLVSEAAAVYFAYTGYFNDSHIGILIFQAYVSIQAFYVFIVRKRF